MELRTFYLRSMQVFHSHSLIELGRDLYHESYVIVDKLKNNQYDESYLMKFTVFAVFSLVRFL